MKNLILIGSLMLLASCGDPANDEAMEIAGSQSPEQHQGGNCGRNVVIKHNRAVDFCNKAYTRNAVESCPERLRDFTQKYPKANCTVSNGKITETEILKSIDYYGKKCGGHVVDAFNRASMFCGENASDANKTLCRRNMNDFKNKHHNIDCDITFKDGDVLTITTEVLQIYIENSF